MPNDLSCQNSSLLLDELKQPKSLSQCQIRALTLNLIWLLKAIIIKERKIRHVDALLLQLFDTPFMLHAQAITNPMNILTILKC